MKRQDSKLCTVCHRPMTWRRKWAKNWDEVKYCSAACRRDKSKRAKLQDDQTPTTTTQPSR
ncbi:MAG TPA: DUF2256 domain-containing protein [Tepidisphaeraceae bacterium]|nr:DUF2256 domain-containing protein [Tepidisphaeraceae bacterium]